MARRKTPNGYCPKCRRPLPREKKDKAARRWRINGDVVVEAVTAYQAWERGRSEGLLRGKFFECTFEELPSYVKPEVMEIRADDPRVVRLKEGKKQ